MSLCEDGSPEGREIGKWSLLSSPLPHLVHLAPPVRSLCRKATSMVPVCPPPSPSSVPPATATATASTPLDTPSSWVLAGGGGGWLADCRCCSSLAVLSPQSTRGTEREREREGKGNDQGRDGGRNHMAAEGEGERGREPPDAPKRSWGETAQRHCFFLWHTPMLLCETYSSQNHADYVILIAFAFSRCLLV